ncbi:Crp/Fnr family transcriptional regulator [Chryseobacterium sp. 3008163]|uniref:Crp/Fnr family transcriptional regulator n=1 Tax=Chryseobacterium sp. 3008163 TaxID=2478663 RepID=UPI000F0CA957|nr:Crp/Fnr family transcriptional regulator [Chryseobacterium sp. 3008163]AYN02100.1 Crp/Fnr family transcriptional regulator [Chryseobacterium sp. 3008163]
MLRTNQSFLAYVSNLYEKQNRKEDIIVRSFEEGELLVSQNEEVNKVILLREGIVKCSLTEGNGKEYILEFSGSGEIIGELESIREVKALCTIEALTAVKVYSISIPYFRKLLKEDIVFNGFLLNVFAERISNTSSRASYQQLYTVEESLNRLLELQSEQDIKISKENMAAYLGVSVRSLNRSLKSLLNKDE